MKKQELKGVLPVFQMPYDDRENIDFSILEKEIDWLYENECDGIVFALASEIIRLTEIERKKVAEKICKYVKSNAIVYVKNNSSIGIGAGQMNRLDSAKIGSEKAKKFFNKNILKDSFVASDAFFPFPDSIDVFGKFGVKAIIQPGGSVKDDEVIKRANKYKIAMAFTNMRHFKH